MLARLSILLCMLLGVLALGWLRWREPSSARQPPPTARPIIDKQPVLFTNRTFDPDMPPSDMPALKDGENAECESEFLSSANVRGQSHKTDPTHATLTVTQVKVTLQLKLTIFTPVGVTPHVMEHEEGHRQISEIYYQTADKFAERIAAGYMGRQVEITSADLDAESNKVLQQMATDITDEYNRELDPDPTQLLYDNITDHSRNDVDARDAVAHALKNAVIEAPSHSDAP